MESGVVPKESGATRNDSGTDASVVDSADGFTRDAQCVGRSAPLDIFRADGGGCYAALPAGFDPADVEIDTMLNGNPAYTLALTRITGPCGSTPGYRTASPSTIEICNLCDAPFSLTYEAVNHCSVYPPPDAADGCVQEKVTLSIRMDESACLLDVPAGADLSAPIALQGEFGMLPQTFYLSEITGPCGATSGSGWEHVSATTLEVCGQACTYFAFAPYIVTLQCGVHASDGGPSDANPD